MEKKYFVIAEDTAGNFGVVGKKGYGTENEAITHAENVLKSNGSPNTSQFYVVEAFAVVRRVVPPVEIVRHSLVAAEVQAKAA